MPGLKELNNFRSNLQNMANEANVVSQWKERYEDYPYPENPPLPDVDVDDLLGGLEIPQPTSEAKDEQSFEEPALSSNIDDNLDSILNGMNGFADATPSTSGLDDIDLPSPDIFSMPTDLDFNNLPSLSENLKDDSALDTDDFQNGGVQDDFSLPPSLSGIEDEPIKKSRNKKIDLDKWNASNNDDATTDSKRTLPEDFLPPFDEEVEDHSNEPNFFDENNVQEEPVVNDIDLSQFDFGDDSKNDSPTESMEETTAPSIDAIDVPNPFEDELLTASESNEDSSTDDYSHDEITDDLTADELSSLDGIQDDTPIDLSAFDTDVFGKTENDSELENIDTGDEAFSTQGATDAEKSAKIDEPIEAIEEPQEAVPQIDLSGFDFDSLGGDSKTPSLSDEAHEELEPVVDSFEDGSNAELMPSSLSSNDEESSLGEIEEIPSLEDDVEGAESVDEIEPLEEVEPLEELEELPDEDEGSGQENIGDLNVEVIDEPLPKDNSDNMLPLSNEELDSMEAEGISGNQEIDLGAFDLPEADDVSLYTGEDELEELDSTASPGVAKPKQDIPPEFDSLGGIDISSAGEEANIDEHASFTISNNILDESISDTVGSFSIPDDYTQFSQNSFSYSNAKDKGKDDENIALTITEEEYQRLLDRISSFPLNVRLEIEDYLAHNDDTTISKMEFVHLIISGARLKKIASKLSEILEKPIPIPKGFERKTAEEYEAEKKSFKYKLRHKIIPFATIAGISLLLTSCVLFLLWTFVYIPIVSERFYNKGYTLLEQNKYTDAMKEFDNAGEYKKKKRWYFRYANGFRNKKQFQFAEDIYKKLLFDFNHDKKGGLEYASMLRDDLHNFEKAETVLKRSVLDFHVNDEAALTSLGDTYLEWARENPEKYEKARQTYSSLINMYGRKPPFLSRMMKYFIRTDNLKEVFPLKEYFMSNMKKLNTEDLTELGTYLITKRYESNVDDDDYIKDIDDVRDVLEAPLKRDKDDANANYNMGRFFLYNRKFDVAEHYLAKSIDIYKNTNSLSSGSIMNSIDARRLYGEILSDNKEYLRAQEVYADALSSYQEYSNSRLTSPNKNIGKLYSDYADVNYFISGELGKALQAYTMAINNMNDTPSIKYRIGYIYYQNKNYEDAMKYFSLVHAEKKNDKNLLYGLGNTLYKRGSYYVAQAYYERLMEMLEAEKIRKNVLLPHVRPDHNAFINEYMQATNNLGVILNKLAMQDGSSEKNGRAMALFGESSRAWDALTRNPETMVASKAKSLAYLNIQNIIKPQTGFETEIYTDIPKTLENEIILTKDMDR